MRSAALVLLLLCVTVSLKAQVFQGKQVSHLSLVSGAVTPGKPFTLGIRLQLEPGWHTYWSTPGDAGTAMIVSLVNSPEYSIGPLQFPTPHKMVSEDLITYGYEDDVVFLVRVKPTSPSASHRLTFKINWLACLSVCLPAEATITFDLDSLSPAQTKEDQKLLDKWTARLPQPGAGFNLDKCAATYSVTKDNKYQVFIKFFQTAPDTISDFFPDDQENMVIEYNSIHATSDGVVMTIEPSTVGAPLEKLTGVALIGTTGYDVSIPVSKQ